MAVTVRLVSKMMVHVPVPGHVAVGLPLTAQPVKKKLGFGAAVKVIWVPSSAVWEQSLPQSMPVPFTEPVPLPVVVTVSVR